MTSHEAFEKWWEDGGYQYDPEAQEWIALAGFNQGVAYGRSALIAEIKAEPLARVIAEGQYEFPRLEWLSADHSFRYTPMYLLYRLPEGDGE